MKRTDLYALLAAFALVIGMACRTADLLADKPTPAPTQPPAVRSTSAAPVTTPTIAPAIPTVAPPAAAASPTSPVAAPPPSVCANPNAAITAPAMNGAISGLIEIRGTAANPNLQYWKVEYRPDSSSTYSELNHSDTAVTDGVLARWSTKTVPNGVYRLRLVVVQKDGNFGTPCEIKVTISN